MHLIGRWERVRFLNHRGLSAPFVLDRKWKSFKPYYNADWTYIEDVWLPTIRGGSFNSVTQSPTFRFGMFNTAAGTQTTVALNSTYTFGSAGAASGGRWRLPVAKTLNNLYFYVVSYTGTAANVSSLLVELRNDSSNAPGSTVHANQTKDPASATGWINCSGLSYAASADTTYWLSVAEDSYNGTDSATVLTRMSNVAEGIDGLYNYSRFGATDTANGWSTTTMRANTMSMVATFSDGTSIGDPFSAAGTAANNTERRGFYIGGFTETIKILGMIPGAGSNNISALELYDSVTAPGGSVLATGNTQTLGTTHLVSGFLFETPPTAAKATVYRLVFTYSAAATSSPRKITIGTGADANLRAAMLGGGNFYWAQANGTTNWNNDDNTGFPQADMILVDQVEVAASGGGPLIGPGRLLRN